MLDQLLAKAQQLNTGWFGFVLEHWLTLAIALIILGFLLDQLLYCLRYKPWRRWMHNLRVIRRFFERLFHVSLPWPPDVQPQPARSRPRVAPDDDPDAPLVVRAPEPAVQPAPRRVSAAAHAGTAIHGEAAAQEPVFSPLPRSNAPDIKVVKAELRQDEPITIRPLSKQTQERPNEDPHE